ncbi:MAG: GNAT family N-acetyltransferase [Anaerolineae bacterium]
MITGERLVLRAIERADLPNYVAWLNDPEVIRHLTLYLPMNGEDEEEWYEGQRQNPNIQNFAIETQEGVHIGSIGLMGIDHRLQLAELGIVIGHKSYWGQGYGQEAIHLLLDFAFKTLNLNRVSLRVDEDHPAAIQCYRKCGFVEEGRLREVVFREGRFFDHLIMSILRREYEGGAFTSG